MGCAYSKNSQRVFFFGSLKLTRFEGMNLSQPKDTEMAFFWQIELIEVYPRVGFPGPQRGSKR